MSPSSPGLWAQSRTHHENLFVFVRQCSVSGWAHRARWLLLGLFLFYQTSSAKAEFKDSWKVQNGWVSEEDLKDWHRCKDALARLKSKCNTGCRRKQRQEGACFWISETNPLPTRGWNHLHHKRPPQLLSSSSLWCLTPDPWPLGGAVAVYTVAHWLQPAIETDEMWLQLQTDLKEAIESVWTVIGYPEHCRGTRCHNEMHLFIFPPLFPEKMTGAMHLLTAPALSIYSGLHDSHRHTTCCARGVSGSLTNSKIRIMICSQMRQAGI